MKWMTYQTPQGGHRLGVSMDPLPVEPTRLYDVTDLYPSLLDLIRAGEKGVERVKDMMRTRLPAVEVSGFPILAPILEPQRNVFCVGWNYLKHFKEGIGRRGNQETELPEVPTFFTKNTRSVIGPRTPVPYDSSFSRALDYEAEIAVIIGREGANIPEDQAMDYVFGYTLANDVSARDVQRRHGGQWFKGKSMDGSCPLGPMVVSADEIAHPEELTVRCYINGELRQDATFRQLIFSVPRLISELSRAMTLLPGDILLTGTPDGVGFGRTPPVYLQPGDVMVVASDQLGSLTNVVGRDRAVSGGE